MKKLTNLSSKEYEHPFDRKALNALEGTPGLEYLVKKFYEHGVERLLRIQYTGSNLKVNKQNFPDLYGIFFRACETLSIKQIPDLYLSWHYGINAFTSGVKKPIVILFSGCVDLLTEKELIFIIGHELGHIKSRHVLYHEMATVFPVIGNVIGNMTLGIGGLVTEGLQLALLNWHRMSEFTADRAGLLACQDPQAAANAMVKMAGLPQKYFSVPVVDSFIKQAQEFDDYSYDTLDKMAKILSIMWEEHPWTVMRGSEFFKWMESGEYAKIINRESQINYGTKSKGTHCTNCGRKNNAENQFCPGCGMKLKN